MKRDEWVRVKSEDELRPGMAVQVRPCLQCEKEVSLTLFSIEKGRPGDVCDCGAKSGWASTHDDCAHRLSCFCDAIATGRLYRLADWNFDETSDDTTAPVKVLVGTEERR
jgi:hypothetical protein